MQLLEVLDCFHLDERPILRGASIQSSFSRMHEDNRKRPRHLCVSMQRWAVVTGIVELQVGRWDNRVPRHSSTRFSFSQMPHASTYSNNLWVITNMLVDRDYMKLWMKCSLCRYETHTHKCCWKCLISTWMSNQFCNWSITSSRAHSQTSYGLWPICSWTNTTITYGWNALYVDREESAHTHNNNNNGWKSLVSTWMRN